MGLILLNKCSECGCPDLIHDDIDNVTFCGYCGLIPEINPKWSLTATDIGNMLHEDLTDHPRKYFNPTVNDKGYQKYSEHVDSLWEKLGIK